MEMYEEDEEMGIEEDPTTIHGGACYPLAEAEHQELVENAQLFLQKLKNFHSSFGTNFSTPCVGGTPLDLHGLFVEVTSRGGLDQVVRDRRWQEVISALELTTTSISCSFVLRKHYMSLLYHFEQVYLFRKSGQTAPTAGSVNQIAGTQSAAESTGEVLEDSDTINHSPGSPELQTGVSLIGIIDEKFDNGYVVSVNLGFDNKLKGILYHIPDKPPASWSPNPSTPHHRSKKSRLALLDPSKAQPTMSSYNFFAEHYATPQLMSGGPECVSKDSSVKTIE